MIFTKADGPRRSRAKALAYAIIEQLNWDFGDSATEQERAKVRDEMDNLEVLLAFLCACSKQGLLSSVTLSDMEESSHLNHQCELILGKIRKSDILPTRPDRLWTQPGVWP